MSFSAVVMKDLRGYMKPEEIMKVINHTCRFRDHVMLRILWTTGCRVSELLMIRFEDIAWKDRLIVIWTLKRRKPVQRIVAVDQKTLSIIEKYCNKRGIKKGPLFNVTRRRVQQIVYETGKAAGIPKVGKKKLHPHHFRHSHAVAWVRENPTMEGLRKLQQRLGHADIRNTAHYLQFAAEEQEAEVESVFGKW